MSMIRWQLVAPIADRRAFKGDLLAAPYRSGSVNVDATGDSAVSEPIPVTPPQQPVTHVLLVVDVYAGGALLIVTDEKPATLLTDAHSVNAAGEDDLPRTLIIADGEAPDVATREIRALRIGQHFFFQAAER